MTAETSVESVAAALNAACRAAMVAEDALADALTPSQKMLLDALSVAHRDEEDAQTAWLIENLARHLPGAAPAIRALAYDHIRNSDDRDGACCMQATVPA